MDRHRFDQLAKSFGAVGSRRSVVGGLLGGVLGLSRISGAGATHRPGHHCTPSHQQRCPDGQECREVGGEWTCRNTCRAFGAGCRSAAECCQNQVDPVVCCAQTPGEPAVCDTDCPD